MQPIPNDNHQSPTKSPRPSKLNLTARQQIADWYTEGESLSTIAARASELYRTNVSVATIYGFIQKFNTRQLERIEAGRQELIASEISKIDRLEREYWDAWKRSIERASMQDTHKITNDDSDNDGYDRASTTALDEFINTIDNTDDANNHRDNNTTPSTTTDSNMWDNWTRVRRQADVDYSDSGYTSRRGRPKNRNNKFHSILPIATDDDQPKPPKVTFTRKIVETCGDPRFLAGIQWCIDRRAKLLGLDAPTKSINAQMTVDDMKQMARELAMSHGMDPDLVVDSVVSDAQKMLALPASIER